MQQHDILQFWFDQLTPKQWFVASDQIDQLITQRFSEALLAAGRCELFSWRVDAVGRLAEIIVLDQFSRNIFRNQARAFANDPLALALAQEAIALKLDAELSNAQKAFLYMPFMHSESALIHEQAVVLFSQAGLESNLAFELKHKAIIDRFGRYPHRNKRLERESSPEEIEFLQQPGSSF